MTWPVGWSTVTVNGDYTAAGPSGSVASGTVEFDTVPARLPSAQYGVIAVGTVVGTLAGGLLSVTLAATDSLAGLPFVWRVTEKLADQPVRSYYITIPAGTSPVSLATAVYTGDLPPNYTVVTGPQGLQGPKGDKGNDGGGGNYDPLGSAATALATAEAYTDTKVAAEVGRADAAYDHTGAAGTAAAAALASANTHADTGDAATLAAAEAYTDAHAGGGSGSTIRTTAARIKVENVVLPNTGGWAIVTSSGGTQLAASIKAAVGDRVQAGVTCMRTGGGDFLDLAILNSAGAISQYAGSGTGTPLDEGAPMFYPQSTVFPAATANVQFTVQAGQVDGSGNVTIALVYKGAGSGSETVYASATYPFYLLLTNIGPEPA